MNAKPNDRVSALGRIQILELIVDLCTGILMIFLLGPLFYGAGCAFTEGSTEGLLIMIFPNFWLLFRDLSLATVTPWLILGIAFILGIISRAIFTVYNVFPIKWLEKKVIARMSFQLVKRWHGIAANWTHQKIIQELVEKTPFHQVGKSEYAEFRANLEDPGSKMKQLKPLWDHELFLYLRSQHFYGMFLSFFLLYIVYGIGIIVLKGLHLPEFGIWLGILFLIFIAVVLLFQEIIIHGVAFFEINGLASEQFHSTTEHEKKSNGPNEEDRS